MEIKSNEIKVVDIDSIIPNPKNLIDILSKSKNMLRFLETHVEMQVFCKDKEYFVKLDYENIESISSIKWKADEKTNSYVSVNATVDKTTIIQSRVIMLANDREFVDHINGDPLDNRKSNLRICSHSQNMQNRRSLIGRKYKGIYFCKKRKKWIAQIHENGKTRNLGRFLTDRQAAIAYNEAAALAFGDFAKLNIVE